MIPERSLEVLRAIVQDYIQTKEPVGSKSLVERHQFGVSSATIRNEMAMLEEEELIHAPHTSAGRVPTDKGYRLFVDRLGEVKPLSSSEKAAISNFMVGSVDLDETLGRTVRLLSQLTNQVAMVQYPSLGRSRVRNIELIQSADTRVLLILITDSGRIQQHVIELNEVVDISLIGEIRGKLNGVLAGAALAEVAALLTNFSAGFSPASGPQVGLIVESLLDQVDANRQEKIILAGTANLARREEDFPGSISPVLEAIEEQVVLLRLLSDAHPTVHVTIGSEQQDSNLQTTSLVTVGYGADPAMGSLGVLGPTRMDYAGSISAVSAVARYVGRFIAESPK